MPLHGLLMYLGSLPLVTRLHRQSPIDCIDAHYVYPDGFAAVLLGRRLGVPVVVSGRGTDVCLFPSFRRIRPMIRWTLRNATGVIGVAQSLVDLMLDLGAPAQRTRAIGNGVDLARFEPLNQRSARQHLGLPADSKILVSVGALMPVKGHPVLIKAMNQIKARHPSARLYIIGEGRFRAELEAMIRDAGLTESIILVGGKPNDELKFWYSAADVSCLVSSREGWANVLLESLGCGTPVVATAVGGAAEVISSPDLGLLVEQNPEAVAAAVEQVLQRVWNREALVRYARSRTWDVVAAEVEDFLRAVIPAKAV
jgi:glycosyltransferase involved in cell wall biosynthesis